MSGQRRVSQLMTRNLQKKAGDDGRFEFGEMRARPGLSHSGSLPKPLVDTAQ
jgi:hypothetical protein